MSQAGDDLENSCEYMARQVLLGAVNGTVKAITFQGSDLAIHIEGLKMFFESVIIFP